MKFLIINGPNLNMLGIREPDIYGSRAYSDLENFIFTVCQQNGIDCVIRQSNHEGVIIDTIQEAYGRYDGIIINPAGYTFTSIAILDALKAVAIPTVEVHLSDMSSRESFRQNSFIALACLKVISGSGFDGYAEAITFLQQYLLTQ